MPLPDIRKELKRIRKDAEMNKPIGLPTSPFAVLDYKGGIADFFSIDKKYVNPDVVDKYEKGYGAYVANPDAHLKQKNSEHLRLANELKRKIQLNENKTPRDTREAIEIAERIVGYEGAIRNHERAIDYNELKIKYL